MEITNYIHTISKCCLFYNFTLKEIHSLLSIDYKIVNTRKNTLLHQINSNCCNLIIILNGTLSLELIDNNNNKLLTVYRFGTSDVVGANTLFSDSPLYKVDIYCTTNCTLMYIPKYEILNLCKNHNFLENLLTHLSKKSQHLLDKISLLSNKTLRESIKYFIKQKYLENNSSIINIGMTKTELAKLLGVERTSLSRELNSMRNNNLISYTRDSITILDLSYFLNKCY